LAGFAACVDDSGWSYLVYTTDAGPALAALGVAPAYTATLAYEQWLDADEAEPVEVAGLRIVAPWQAGRQDGSDLAIDPELAFGTGGHPSTRRCLRLVAALVGASEAADVLDLGCGSGVLSLAALRFGARSAVGCDVSAHAVDVARRNAARNGLDGRATFVHAPAGDLVRPADLVLANLPPAALDELLGHPALRRSPWIVVSGLLAGDFARLAASLPAGVEIVDAFRDGLWHTGLLRR
jgi:ribosomal protein L11 methyltransferase